MPCLPWGATACCDAGRPPMEVTMLQRGEIVVERLTGNRAMVIRVVGPEEVTCRFADGRLEDRFAFELEPLLSPLGSLVWFFLSGFVSRWFRQGSPASVNDRLRLLRPSDSSGSPLAVGARRGCGPGRPAGSMRKEA